MSPQRPDQKGITHVKWHIHKLKLYTTGKSPTVQIFLSPDWLLLGGTQIA